MATKAARKKYPSIVGDITTDIVKNGVKSTGAKIEMVWQSGEVVSEPFKKLVEELIPASPEHVAEFLFQAIERLCNSYRWAGGVPDRSGAVIEVHQCGDWFSFLDKPRSNHIPLPTRIEMAKQYLGLALQRSIGVPEFWQELIAAMPEQSAAGRLLQFAAA